MATELKRSGTMDRIEELLGDNARTLLDHSSTTISKELIQLPGPDFIDRVWSISDRPTKVLRSMQSLFDNGRLAGTGYVSILPVDQGIEHSAGASFAAGASGVTGSCGGSSSSGRTGRGPENASPWPKRISRSSASITVFSKSRPSAMS